MHSSPMQAPPYQVRTWQRASFNSKAMVKAFIQAFGTLLHPVKEVRSEKRLGGRINSSQHLSLLN